MSDTNYSDWDFFRFMLGYDNEYMPDEYLGELFHYTSPNGFLSILNGRPDKASIWASRFDCLNDASEGTVAYTVYQDVCQELKGCGKITSELYSILIDIVPANIVTIVKIKDDKVTVRDLECNRFVCSFSKNCDSLAMWNYYSKGSKYEGFNIGFTSDAIDESLSEYLQDKEATFHIYPVIYGKQDQKKIISEFLLKVSELCTEKDKQSVQETVAEQLTLWGLIFKSEYFKHEEEVRIIVDVAKREKAIAIRYRTNSGYIVPYIELELNKDNISEVYFGPLQCSDDQKKHQIAVMADFLEQSGYDVIVGSSRIPVRY